MATAPLIGDPGLGGATREQYAVDVLHGLGAPITPSNVAAIEVWIAHESGGRTGFAFNPLNTTDHPFGSAGQGGSQGNIQRFSSYQQGVATVVHQLQYPRYGYPAIVAALKQGNDASAVLRAVNASSWGTHNFTAAELGGQVPTPSGVTSSPGAGGGFAATPADVTTPFGKLSLPGPDVTISPFGIVPGDHPGLANPLGAIAGGVASTADAIKAAGSLALKVLDLLTHPQYVFEVLIGVGMILVGVRLIIADNTGKPVVPRPNPAAVAAVAAA